MKWIGGGAIALLAVYALLEVTVQLIYKPSVPLPANAPLDEAVAVPTDSLAPDVKAGRERAGLGFKDPSMALHPYLGFVFIPHEQRETPGPAAIKISEDGFLDPKPLVRKREDGKVIVAITGGSVAGQIGTWHPEVFEAALAKDPAYKGKEFDFVFLGMPGYHQPQQALQLSLALAQGGEFDLFINLDGFNEVAVPAVLNAPQGLHPLFPMNWSMVALDVPDSRVRKAMGAIDYLKEERAARLENFHDSFWSFSPIAKLIRQKDDEKLQAQISANGWRLREFASDEIPWFVRGSERMHLPTEELIPECVAVWERCSLQLKAMCDANGIRYVHVLQPNQYDPGSKPLSRDEREKAFDGESPYRAAIETGYPLLREAGNRLRESGVEFIDLSAVFVDTKQTLYVDNCCHFNKEGNRIMLDAMVEAIAEKGAS